MAPETCICTSWWTGNNCTQGTYVFKKYIIILNSYIKNYAFI